MNSQGLPNSVAATSGHHRPQGNKRCIRCLGPQLICLWIPRFLDLLQAEASSMGHTTGLSNSVSTLYRTQQAEKLAASAALVPFATF